MDGTRDLLIDNELVLYGPIDPSAFWGDEVRAVDVMSSLKAMKGDEITMRLNSPGGSVFEAIAIYNALKADGRKVTVVVDAMAASAASLIAMAGDQIVIRESATIMIHNPWTIIAGDSEDFRKMADEMDRVKAIIVDIYSRKTGKDAEEISALMDAETYMGAAEAIDLGFATAMEARADVAAWEIDKVRMETILRDELAKRMKNSREAKPAAVAAKMETATMPEVKKVEEPVVEKVDTDAIRNEAVKAERERVAAINLAVRNARLDNSFAEKLIADGKTVAEAHAAVIDEFARVQNKGQPEITNVVVGRDETETRRVAMEDALAIRLGAGGTPSEAARQYMDADLVDMAAERVGFRGRLNVAAVKENVLKMAFHTTGDFPTLLENAMNRTLSSKYALVSPTYRAFSKQRTYVDFRDHIAVGVGDFPSLSEVKESGEIVGGTFSEKKEATAVKAYGVQLGISRKLLVNDSLGAIQQMLAGRADTIAAFEDQTFWTMMLSNASAGPTLQETSRGVFNTTDKTKAASGSAIDITSLGAARAAMRKKTSLDGLKLNIAPKILVVGPDYELLAQQYTSSSYVPAQGSTINPFAGGLQVIVSPHITGNAWYVFADPMMGACFEWGLLQGYEAPRFRIEEPFGTQGMQVSLEHDFGCGAIDYRFGWLNAGG